MLLRTTTGGHGLKLYTVGDQVWGMASKGTYAPKAQLDAGMCNNVKGGMGVLMQTLNATLFRMDKHHAGQMR